MRRKRIRTHRTRVHQMSLVGKFLMIGYLMFFSIALLTSDTTAYFTDTEDTSSKIYAGTWGSDHEQRDGSWLEFTFKGNQNHYHACEPGPKTIETEIKNIGEGDMQSDSKYEVYYSKVGNPEDGEMEKLSDRDGIINVLKIGETAKLSFEANNHGFYRFSAYQTNEHSGEEKVWSEKVKVNCPKGHQNNDEQQPNESTNEIAVEPTDEEVDASEKVDENQSTNQEENESETDEYTGPTSEQDGDEDEVG
ncbi:amyloid fiber anchoring/assembly protein TapA [Virgibacillus byunsanensis]|uniref:Amyloid fiber anchoring/assembly protein TapA n=1 Tax=Virgibacillus byunsanensis TaxID=570945 RepID=A0ABW3LNH6_9BACI